MASSSNSSLCRPITEFAGRLVRDTVLAVLEVVVPLLSLRAVDLDKVID